MKDSRLSKALVTLVVLFLVAPLTAQAAPMEPIPSPPPDRPLRSDYVKTWYIFNDNTLNGILDPGDRMVETMENWWTPASSHSQHNYSRDGGTFTYGADSDINSSPINYASHCGGEDFWLGRDPASDNKNTVQFYMTYSQFDNNEWKNGGYIYSSDPDIQAIVKQRHEDRNGWSLGWVTHSKGGDDPTSPTFGDFAGFADMDIYVHDGRGLPSNLNPDGSLDIGGGFGKSYSNPQVSVSNDICSKANDTAVSIPTLGAAGDRYHPPVFDDVTGTYSWPANAARMNYNGMNAADLNDIVNSMEIKEEEPYSLGPADVIWDNRTPSITKATLTDHAGAAYTYDDAFLDNSFYHDGASDGGVIAGLAGESEYDPQINNWGDQQVIRIDISEEMLAEIANQDPNICGNITEIIFWDFGFSDHTTWGTETSDQVHPRAIVIGVDLTSGRTATEGQLYYDTPTGRIYFPENRIYIAQVRDVPEPASLTIVMLGAVAVLLRKRRRAAMR